MINNNNNFNSNFNIPYPMPTINRGNNNLSGINTLGSGNNLYQVPDVGLSGSQGGSGTGSVFGNLDLGNLSGIMQGISAIGSLFSSFQQNQLASDTLNFKKDAYNTNLKNSTQSYNTALTDRTTARHFTEGKTAAQTNNYLTNNKL